jgi:hypothetical protein
VIPLIVIALLVSAGLATYEFSGRAHEWVDEHVRAMRSALAAHESADASLAAAKAAADAHAAANHAAAEHLAAAKAAPGSNEAGVRTAAAADLLNSAARGFMDAMHYVFSADTANRAAAQETGKAVKAAKTDDQRAIAAQSATAVVDRGEKIKAALAQLGVGQCDARSYAGVTPQVKDALLSKLHGEGMTVTGDNPWDIDTHKYDVKLRAVWDPHALALKLIVTSGEGGYGGLVTCSAIWAEIDPILNAVMGSGSPRAARSSGNIHGGSRRR